MPPVFENISFCINEKENLTKVVSTYLAIFEENFRNIHGYVSASACVFGIVTNIANIVVLTRPTMICSATNWLLMCLAIADLLTMLVYLPHLIKFYIFNNLGSALLNHTNSWAWVVYQKLMVSCTISFHAIAVWLTVSLAVFRFICIYMPISGPSLCSITNASKTTIVISILCFMVAIPNMLVTKIQSCQFSGKIPILYLLHIDNSFVILNKLNFWLQATCFKLIPSVFLTALTVGLILSMKKATQRQSNLLNNSKSQRKAKQREQRTTIMLLAVVLLFLLTEAPQGFLILLSYFKEDFYENVYQKLGDLIDFFTLVNESTNFILYTTMSKQFRSIFSSIFCPCCTAPSTNNTENASVHRKFTETRFYPMSECPTEKTRLHKLVLLCLFYFH